MKILARLLLLALLVATAGLARADRVFNQAELDALLAPVALYPDAVLNDILAATSFPQDVREAAAWSRVNPQLRGEDALRAAEPYPWQPSVKALAAFPELLARMDESPQWLADLGEAYRVHGPYVMQTVQALRARAQANGYQPEPVAPGPYPVYAVRYYDPYVVYGTWWWPAYRPIVWRPWIWPVVIVSRPVYTHRVVVQRPVYVRGPVVTHTHFEPRREYHAEPRREYHAEPRREYRRVPESQRQPIVQQNYASRPVPEAQRRPIVQQNNYASRPMPQARGYSNSRESAARGGSRPEPRSQGQRGHDRRG